MATQTMTSAALAEGTGTTMQVLPCAGSRWRPPVPVPVPDDAVSGTGTGTGTEQATEERLRRFSVAC
jgi:hypothetical protein